MAISYQTLPDGAAVRAAAPHSRFVHCFTTPDTTGCLTDGALAWRREFFGFDQVMVEGDPAAAAALLTAMFDEDPPRRITLPREVMELMPERYMPERMGRWRWFHTSDVPAPVAGEERVCWLPDDEAGKAAIEELLDAAFPDASNRTNSPEAKRWFGVPGEDGKPIACGLVGGPAADVPFLASVAVHPSARRQGIAAAMTAWVTRTLLGEGHEFVALGSMEGEDATHRIYRRVGYVDSHMLNSGWLAREAVRV